jgi:hypothetical protein
MEYNKWDYVILEIEYISQWWPFAKKWQKIIMKEKDVVIASDMYEKPTSFNKYERIRLLSWKWLLKLGDEIESNTDPEFASIKSITKVDLKDWN